jgi:hypothetical protein
MPLLPLLLSALNLFAAPAPTATIPTAQGAALDGHTVALPHDLSASATILILGFTQHSSDATTAWEKPVHTDLVSQPAIGFYEFAFIEDAPSFIRPMIVRSIRRQVPDPLKPNFLPLSSNQAAWKSAVGFTSSAPDAAYVLLVDRSGAIRWQTHEACTPQLFKQLAAEARKLAATP